ncbi:unnamed protein product [Phytophthora fragariaefolia]|uniref:Cytoplasmic dynein 2 light intermediate chain 1 n=1 Tax=Phytophthora fragariaefolia TaxID=1490495 RepID=A0A9W6XZW4_9STRA|nr:unnamed protein product [Phytophthora fragariaefolia]
MATKDIWTLISSVEDPAKKPQKATERVEGDAPEKPAVTTAPEERDTFTLIVGPRGSGKTSLTATFRNSSKAEEIKPTTALDYVFVRLRTGGRPAVAHMWELASTKCVNEMIKIPLGPERILNGALVIVIDLSAPGDVVPALVKWLTTLYSVVHEVLKAKEKNPVEKFAVDVLKQEAMARYGSAHPDKDEVTPLPLPVLVVGNKYETFRDEDSIKRKGVTQAVRYLAHMYGASLLFTSMKDKNLVNQFRSIMKGFAFRAMARGTSKEVDPAKPLFVPAGADLFEDIGIPKSAGWRQDRFGKEQHEEKARQWVKIASEYYPPSANATEDLLTTKQSEQEDKDGEESPNQFPEPNIDRARQQKRYATLLPALIRNCLPLIFTCAVQQGGAASVPRQSTESAGAQVPGCLRFGPINASIKKILMHHFHASQVESTRSLISTATHHSKHREKQTERHSITP